MESRDIRDSALQPQGEPSIAGWLGSRGTRLVGAIGGASLVLAILGSWTYHAVEQSLRDMRATMLASVLDAEAKALEVWIGEKRLAVEHLAQNEPLRQHVAALALLAGAADTPHQRYCTSAARGPIEAQLQPYLRKGGVAIYRVVERGGRVIASQQEEDCGQLVGAGELRKQIDAVLLGETRFVRPYRGKIRPAASGAAPTGSRPIIWIETPLRDASGRIVAALGLGEYADARFANILATARIGDSGEVYAFDERAMMLSGSRFTQQLIGLGLLAPAPDASAVLTVQLREPGPAAEPLESRPLTRLASEALAAVTSEEHRGAVLEPYINYRGARVIGAWRWLPEYDMGMAVELEADEAYAPLVVLNTVFGAIFGALVLAVAAALFFGLWQRRQAGARRQFGAYKLERLIGEGGMANVYLAHHALLKRPTAVKILRPDMMNEQFVARFEREVKLASQLVHPNAVEIYDYGHTPDGLFYYAMEYLDGLELLQLIKQDGAAPIARAVYLLRQLCAGLAEAHAKGLVHRDVKPENIMVCARGGEYDVVKILDFGLVKNVAEPHSRDLTRSLRILGTPLYMAPERFRNPGDVDARADIYSVGAVAFYLLTGRELFTAEDDLELANRVLNDEAPRPSTCAPHPIPIELDLLVTSCLEKRREDRPQHVADLIEAFDALAVEHRWTQREAAQWWAQHRPQSANV